MRISVDGTPVEAAEGVTVAVALIAARVEGFAPLCGMGICLQCRVTIDGVLHARSCQIQCRDGMEIRTR